MLASSLNKLRGERLYLVWHGFQFCAGLQAGKARIAYFLRVFVLLWWSLKARAD